MERMTKDLLTNVAEGLVHERRTRHGDSGSDGVRRPAPERGGLGLFDAGRQRQLLAENRKPRTMKPSKNDDRKCDCGKKAVSGSYCASCERDVRAEHERNVKTGHYDHNYRP